MLWPAAVFHFINQDDFIGVVGADVTVDFLNKIVSEFEPQRKGSMIVFDANLHSQVSAAVRVQTE